MLILETEHWADGRCTRRQFRVEHRSDEVRLRDAIRHACDAHGTARVNEPAAQAMSTLLMADCYMHEALDVAAGINYDEVIDHG